MNDSQTPCACPSTSVHATETGTEAERLTALAHEARLLEFGLEGDGEAACGVARELEGALTNAMDAESADELTCARDAIDAVLARLVHKGMRLSAQLSDIEVGGVLGTARLSVLTAVLSA